MSFPESALDLLNAPGTAMLSTKTPDGLIQTTAVWYLFDDDQLKISIAGARKKLRNLQEDPAATVFLLDATNPFHFIEVRGKATLEADPEYAFRNKVGAKYGADMTTFDAPGTTRYTVTINPDRINAQ
jgi:PPOX class probable F420-dependent enzyme